MYYCCNKLHLKGTPTLRKVTVLVMISLQVKLLNPESFVFYDFVTHLDSSTSLLKFRKSVHNTYSPSPLSWESQEPLTEETLYSDFCPGRVRLNLTLGRSTAPWDFVVPLFGVYTIEVKGPIKKRVSTSLHVTRGVNREIP